MWKLGGVAPVSIVADPTGHYVYVLNKETANISTLKINPKTGALTLIGTLVKSVSGPTSMTITRFNLEAPALK